MVVAAVPPRPTFFMTHLIAIGASTGGPDAVREVLRGLPANCPPVVVAQHMQESFIARFAANLTRQTALQVQEARGGERAQPGHAYLAPGHANLRVNSLGEGFVLELTPHGDSLYTPSVDVLFHSVAQAAGKRALGVLLTGMGRDGAAGLLAMRRAGAWTIAQDQASSVVWGMPRAAAELGAAEVVAPLTLIGQRLRERLGLFPPPLRPEENGGK
jgi:two-component system chemotaxis response regulator CheB